MAQLLKQSRLKKSNEPDPAEVGQRPAAPEETVATAAAVPTEQPPGSGPAAAPKPPSEAVVPPAADHVADLPSATDSTPPETDRVLEDVTSFSRFEPVPVVEASQPAQAAVVDRAPVSATAGVDPARAAGIELPTDLYERLMRRLEKSGQKGSLKIRQTELFLRAFEACYGDLDAIITAATADLVVDSPLFGLRTVQAATISGPISRLQVRPRYSQYTSLQNLASGKGLSLAGLTRIVLKHYLDQLDAADAAARAKAKV